ncbi:MAG: hypothetical protein K940chlam7_00460 [Chlamydiae bacterium]|nr:hypothetical protein [Chlamydiota bacterium]
MIPNLEQFLRALFLRFQKTNLEYVVLRNYEEYPYSVHKPDIGILISPQHQKLLLHTFKSACQDAGCMPLFKFHPVNMISLYAIQPDHNSDGSPFENFIKVDARTYKALKFKNLMENTPSLNYKVFLWEIKKKKINLDGCEFYILDQPDEIILLLKQWKRKKDPRHKKKIFEQLKKPLLADWIQQINDKSSTDIKTLLENPEEPEYDLFFKQCVQTRWGKNTFTRFMKTQLIALGIAIKRKFSSLPPVFYFSGPDGAGKTTATNEVKSFFERQHIPYKYFYTLNKILRHIGMRFLWVKHLLLAKNKPSPTFQQFKGRGNGHLDRNTGNWSWRIKKRLSLVLSFLDFWLGWILATSYRFLGYTILIETSPYDLFIKYHMPYFPGLESTLTRLIPRPNSGFLFKASPNVIRERKKELNQDEIRNYYCRIENLLNNIKGNNYKTIDSGQGIDKMSIKIREEILVLCHSLIRG